MCHHCKKRCSAKKKSFITKYPSFMCIVLCRRRKYNKDTISSAVQFPALGFDIKGDNAPYDLSATVHHMPRKDDGGHYTAIVRSKDLQSQEWFMYDDDTVSTSKFTNKQKKHTMVLKNHMKTATILFYVCPSLKTRIKNAKTIDLIEVEKDTERTNSEMNSCETGVENSGDIDVDGEEGYVDGYMGDGEEGNADGHRGEGEEGGSNEGAATVAPVGAVIAAVGVHDEEEKGDSSEEASPTAASSATTRRKKRKKAREKKALRRAELFPETSSSSSSSDDEDYKETIRDRRKSKKKVNKARKKAAKQRSTKKTVRSDSESSSSSDSS